MKTKDVDNNYMSLADTSDVFLTMLLLPRKGDNPTDYDDTLKFSKAESCGIDSSYIIGGTENAIDMNRECRWITVRDTTLVGGDHCAVVIKGGCEFVTLQGVLIRPGGGAYEIELGGWSDQSRKKTRQVHLLHVMRTDGKPVRVVVGNAEKPSVVGWNVKILFWRSLGLKLFVWAKGLFQ